MSERRTATKGRRLGSSRRKQLREGSGETPAPAPGPSEEPPWASEIVQRVQQLLSSRDTEQEGCVTRSDLQKLQEEGVPCSAEELELVFNGLDAAGTGRLGTEEFMAGLRQFLSSQNAAKEHRRRKTASRRVRLVLPGPALEGVDSEERRHFAAFMEQLGTDNISEEQEIWQLWVKLRQDEPQLLDNLEGFLAKMRHRIQDVRSEKEALELTLNKRVAEHDKDVQQLCEVLEQQIQQEQLRLRQQSAARSQQHSEELQRVLDASEREVQRLVSAQMELERRCRSLHSSQQVTSMENRQLQESNRALEDQLQHLHQQLQQTQGHLRTMRATVTWEQLREPRDRVVAELPIEVPMSPQLSPGSGEKFRSEMRIRLGSQSGESKAKSTRQAVWEMLPAEISLSPVPRKASSAEEDPFQESLKEERFSDQSSLLREMNDAIAALSKHLKAQAPGAPPALADTPYHPWGDAEPQTGPEAATAHGTTPEVLQETLPGHVHHELLEGDLLEEPATQEAELRAPDVTQTGASTGAGRRMAQEPGAEQGESPEEAQRMLFLQGKGAGVEEMVLNMAEHLGESTEAGEQVLMEVEGAGWMQEKTGWEKPQLLGEAEEVEINQGENLEAGLGPPETGQEGVAVGQCPAMEELQPGGILGECVQAPDTAQQEWAEQSLGRPEKLETELGEHLEPEAPSWGEAQVEAARGDGVPEVTVAPGLGMLQEEDGTAEVQPLGEPEDSKVLEVLPARAECAGSSRARGEEEEVEEAEPREAEQQLQGESARGGAGWAGSTGTQGPLAAAVPPTHGQEGGMGTDVELLEAQSSDTNMELLAEVEADLQVSSEAGSPGTQQGGDVDPGVPLEKEDKAESGLGEEMGAAAGHCEGPAPAETPVRRPDLGGQFPVKSQELELVEADLQLCGDLSPEPPQGGKGGRDVQLQEDEEEDGTQEQGEYGLALEPVPHPNGVTLGQGEGAGAGLLPQEEAESLDTAEDQSTGANVQLTAGEEELRLTPGGSTETDLQLVGEAGSPGTEHGGGLEPDVHPLDQVNEEELVEVEAEDAQEDTQLSEGLSSGVPWGGEIGTDAQTKEEEHRVQVQGECELSHEPVLDLQGAGVRQGEGADGDMQAQEEAESLDTIEDWSSGGNVQLIAEGNELTLTPGGSTEADLQLMGEAGSPGTEHGGRLDPDMHPLNQVNEEELVEVEGEDAQEDTQLSEGLSPGVQRGAEIGTDVLIEEEEHGAQGQGECELSHKPVFDLQGSGVRQGEGADGGMQAQEEAESLDTVEDQSSGGNVQLIAERGELTLTPGGSTETDLQPLGEAGSPGTEQGGGLDPDVQPLDQVDKEKFLEMEAEDAQEDRMLCECLSPRGPWEGEGERDVQIEEKEDGAQGQGECEVAHEAAWGAGVGQGERADGGRRAQEEAASLDITEEQSSGVSVQLTAQVDELQLSPRAQSTEADLQPLSHTDSQGTEQGGSVAPEVHPLEQVHKAESVEMEAENAQEDTMFHEGLSPGGPWGGQCGTDVHLREEEEDGAQGQGECELPHEPVLDPQGAGVRQGEGAGAGLQPGKEAENLDTVEEQSSGASVELIAEGNELKSASGESTEADLQPLSEMDSLGTEQGGSVAPDVHFMDQVDKKESAEMEAENAQEDAMSHEGLSPEAPWRVESGTDVHLKEEEEKKEGEAQGQVECELPQEPVLDLQGAGVRQGEGADGDMQAQEEAESLDTIEDQSSGGNVQLIAERGELTLTPGGSTEADLQPLSEMHSLGTEQGASVAPDVHPMEQVDKKEFLEMEAENAQEDLMFHEGLSPWRGEGGTAVQLEEEDGAQGQGECELPHGPVLDLQGSGVRQTEGAGAGVQLWEETESLDTAEEQSTDTSVQLTAEGNELKSAPGESREADLQPLSHTDSLGTEQGGSVAPDVHPVEQVDKKESVEMETEDSWRHTQLCGGASPEIPQGEGSHAAVQPRDGAGDWGQGQGEHGLGQELVPRPSGVSIRQRRETDAGVQPWEEVAILDTAEDQSTSANVQLIAGEEELRLTPGGSTEADLQPLGDAGSPGTEHGGGLDSDAQPLDQVKKAESVEVEAEDAPEDAMFHEGLSPGAPWRGESGTDVHLREEKEDKKENGAQGQGECELSHEPVLDLQGSGVRQGEGTDGDMQAQEEAESLDTIEDQSSGGNVQLIAEGNELKSASGESTEADLQPLGEAGSPGTEHRGKLDPDVHPYQVDKKEVLEMEVEDAQKDMMFREGLSPGAPWRGESGTDVHLREEKEDKQESGAQGQGECGLPQELVLDLQGAGVGQTEGTDASVQLREEAESLGTVEEQGTDANVQLIAEGSELKSASRESLGSQWVGEAGTAIQVEEDGAQGQGEHGLPRDSVPDPQGAGGRQGGGAGTGPQPQDEAESLDPPQAQSTDADVQLQQQEPKSGPGGSRGADLTPLGVAGIREGEQSLSAGLEAGLGAAPTADPWQGVAEAALCPEPVPAAQGPGLEAKLGACIAPERQILEDTQALELLQGERAAAEGKPLDGAHGLEVAQGERLEAGARNAAKTQGLGLNQGCDDAVPALASPVSAVLSQSSTPKLETLMQEDVLIPDVWRLCAPGQAAQRELQEQVSAQGHEGRLPTAALQPEGETRHAMEPEHEAAEPAGPPKQEVPSASAPHTTVRPEGAGSEQLGMSLRESSLGQAQLSGEQSKDVSAGQREKMQEFRQKMSQEGEPSPAEPGAVTAGGAGAGPRGCPKAPQDPDHLYNVLFVGDSHVGKTSFLYRLHADTFNPHLSATVGLDYQIKSIVVDNKRFALRLWDSAGQERYHSMTKQFFRKADGVVLMYDITSEYSFSDVRYWLSCIQEAAEDGVAVLLLGNKTDCAAQRQVPTKEGECLAKEHQLMFYECSAASGHNVFESMVSFIRLLKVREDELKSKAEEVPKAPQKKKGCCW